MSKRIGIIFGGRSEEHEISILSAASVLSAIDRDRYEPVPFAIDKTGAWHLVRTDMEGLTDLSDERIVSIFKDSAKTTISDFDAMTDFAFPLLHGPYGEDGTIQGLFEMLDKPYAGCGVTASAVSMDKIIMKEIWTTVGLPQARYTYTTRFECSTEEGLANEALRIERKLSSAYPFFVKPANMGSSVGISKASSRAALEDAIKTALIHDKRVIAEEGINGRELEIAVLGNDDPKVSEVGEIIAENEYYDYHSKYRGSGTKLVIPADISGRLRDRIGSLSADAYRALDGEGFARVDLFYDERQEIVYMNEMNTIPGFTRFSMFPLLWKAKGVEYTELIERIVTLGYERHNAAYHR